MLLITDGNNLAWAGFHALRRPMGADTPEKKARAALLGLTQSVVGLAVRGGMPPEPNGRSVAANPNRVSGLAVAFDEGRPLRRRSIFPAYQTGREGDPNFIDNEPFVLDAIAQFSEAAANLPIVILRGKNTEADDLAAALAEQSPAERTRIASTDRDFLQLVDERTSIYSPVKRIVIDHENFSEMTAPRGSDEQPVVFPRERYLDYRVASGDPSDNLPGIPGIGALTAARLLAKAELDTYLNDPGLVSDALGRRNQKLEATLAQPETLEIVARNRVLMDLHRAAKEYESLDPYTTRGTWNEADFRAWVKDQRVAGLEIDAAVRAMEAIASAG